MPSSWVVDVAFWIVVVVVVASDKDGDVVEWSFHSICIKSRKSKSWRKIGKKSVVSDLRFVKDGSSEHDF